MFEDSQSAWTQLQPLPMHVELRSIFFEFKAQPPTSIALVCRSLRYSEVWEDGEKFLRPILESGADKFSAELTKAGIQSVPIDSTRIKAQAEVLLQCEMCVVSGEPFYSLISIAKQVRKMGYKGPIRLEITSSEAERAKYIDIATRAAERLEAVDLLSAFVYLTKKRGSVSSITFAPSELVSAENDAEELHPAKALMEAQTRSVILTKTERNSDARRQCIQTHGSQCALCGFDFSVRFGSLGAGLIHVHHLSPLSEAGGVRPVNPATDLLPVCPNCHFFIHSRLPMYSVMEVLSILQPSLRFEAEA